MKVAQEEFGKKIWMAVPHCIPNEAEWDFRNGRDYAFHRLLFWTFIDGRWHSHRHMLTNFGYLMRLYTRSFIFVLLMGVVSLAIANPTESAAIEFIQRQQLDRNLKVFAVSVALRTQTFAMMASKIGTPEAKLLVLKELDACIGQFQGQWDANLAKIYARYFTQEELASLTVEGRNSPYVNKLAAKQEVIGAEMQQQSTPILKTYVTTAMNSAFAKLPSR